MGAEVKSLLNRMAHTPFTCILICPEIGLAIETNIRHGMDYAPDDDQCFETANAYQDNWLSIKPENISQVCVGKDHSVLARIKNTHSYLSITFVEEATV